MRRSSRRKTSSRPAAASAESFGIRDAWIAWKKKRGMRATISPLRMRPAAVGSPFEKSALPASGATFIRAWASNDPVSSQPRAAESSLQWAGGPGAAMPRWRGSTTARPITHGRLMASPKAPPLVTPALSSTSAAAIRTAPSTMRTVA